MRRIIVFIWALTLSWVGTATSQEPQKKPAPSKGYKAVRDIHYAEDGHARNRLDLFLPEKNSGRFPVIVWIHGGAWWTGSKEGAPASWTAKGYAVASVNYRLSQHALFPAQIEDCKAAVRWLRANADKYNLDPGHIGAWGLSAGGHLCALLGVTAGVKDFDGQGGNLDQSSRVQAVVDVFGPADLVKFQKLGDQGAAPVTKLIGGRIQENEEKARKASPVTYVAKDAAPFLIFHGDRDGLVPLEQSELLAEALKKAKVEVTFRVIKGGGHGGSGFNAPEIQQQIDAFFDKHLHNKKELPSCQSTMSQR